jgi:hypothetical protein
MFDLAQTVVYVSFIYRNFAAAYSILKAPPPRLQTTILQSRGLHGCYLDLRAAAQDGPYSSGDAHAAAHDSCVRR